MLPRKGLRREKKKSKRTSEKPLLIGQAPSAETEGRPAFDGRSGRFLASLLGLPLPELFRRLEATNLIGRFPGKAVRPGKGDLFPTEEAKEAAAKLDVTGREVLLAGKKVAAAFGLKKVGWFEPTKLGKGERSAKVIPHPSGVNRWWNDEKNREKAKKVLKKLLET